VLKMFLLMLAAAATFAADDPWQKVKDLKSGTDLRVFRRGSTQPQLVQMGDLTDDNLVVIDKKAERAIPREEIDRIDSRPPKPTWGFQYASFRNIVGLPHHVRQFVRHHTASGSSGNWSTRAFNWGRWTRSLAAANLRMYARNSAGRAS
jgi:hypothetical protein